MANMSYCRFQNTVRDLNDCLNALRDRDIASKEEMRAAKRLLTIMLDFLQEEDIIDGYNSESLKELLEECK